MVRWEPQHEPIHSQEKSPSRSTIVGCDIHTHAPATNGSTNIMLYPFLLRTCLQTLLGIGMGMNVTAQIGFINETVCSELRRMCLYRRAHWESHC